MSNKFRGKAYIASGWFSPAQRSALDEIERVVDLVNLHTKLIDAYSPRRDNPMNKITGPRSTEDRMKCFREDVDKVRECDFMIVSTVEYDTGSIFEMGLAYALGKPIICYNDNPEDHKKIRNLMLVGACDDYYAKNGLDLMNILENGNPTKYGDDSESEMGRLGEDAEDGADEQIVCKNCGFVVPDSTVVELLCHYTYDPCNLTEHRSIYVECPKCGSDIVIRETTEVISDN